MEGIDVHKLPRKELIQLCTDHNIRTAGVKQDDLIRLLEKKLRPPASDPTRKARGVIGTNSPVSSPKARSQSSINSPFSSPNTKGKSAERAFLPTPGSTIQGRSLRPLVLVDDRSRNSSRNSSRNNSPEPSPRTPRKDQLSPSPGVKPRTPIPTKSNAAPTPQRSTDLLRKKMNNLTAIGKLQAQERTRPAQVQIDGSSVRGRNIAAAAPIGKQAQETRRQPDDRGSSVRSRSNAVVGAPKKNIKSTSMPVKRPSERTVGVKSNEASGKGKSANPNAAGYSEVATSEGDASVAATDQDLGSHSFNSVSEVATDAGYHDMWEDSDADDAQSVSSEPVSRFALQSLERERFNHSPRTSTGSKLGRVAYPSLESAHQRRSSLDSSVESNTPFGKDFVLSTAPGEDFLPSLSLEGDTAFDLVGDTHGLEINSFLDAHSGAPKVNAVEGSHLSEELGQVQERDIIAKPVNNMGEQDPVSETAPSTMQKDIVSDNNRSELVNSGNPTAENDVPVSDHHQEDSSNSAVESNAPVAEQEAAATPLGSREKEFEMTVPAPEANEQELAGTRLDSRKQEIEMAISAPEGNDIPVASSTDVTDAIEAEGVQVVESKENVEGDKWFDSTLNLVQDEDSPEEGVNSQATIGKNIQLLTEYPAPCYSPTHQESPNDSGVQLAEKNDPTCCVGKDYSVSSTAECIERVHFNMDGAPLPHPDMERTSLTIISINRPDASPMPDSTAGDLCAGKSASPCDELQPEFDIKLRGGQGGSSYGPKNDHTKGRIRKSILLQSDRSEKVPLLQDGRENDNMQLARRTFPSSILLWCSQLWAAIFGTRSCQQ